VKTRVPYLLSAVSTAQQHSFSPGITIFSFFFPFLLFGLVLLNYISIFFYFYILLRRRLALRLYRLKGKKGLRRHVSPYRLKNYAILFFILFEFYLSMLYLMAKPKDTSSTILEIA
jgi:hypothetical protein